MDRVILRRMIETARTEEVHFVQPQSAAAFGRSLRSIRPNIHPYMTSNRSWSIVS